MNLRNSGDTQAGLSEFSGLLKQGRSLRLHEVDLNLDDICHVLGATKFFAHSNESALLSSAIFCVINGIVRPSASKHKTRMLSCVDMAAAD